MTTKSMFLKICHKIVAMIQVSEQVHTQISCWCADTHIKVVGNAPTVHTAALLYGVTLNLLIRHMLSANMYSIAIYKQTHKHAHI